VPRRWCRTAGLDVLAANPLGRALHSEMYADPVQPPNHGRFIFFNPRAHDFYLDWDRAANDTVAILRAEAGRDPYDRGLSDLVGELSTRSEEIRTRWAAHNVRIHRAGVKHFRHPVVADLGLTFEMMELSADPGMNILTYSPNPAAGPRKRSASSEAGRPRLSRKSGSTRRTKRTARDGTNHPWEGADGASPARTHRRLGQQAVPRHDDGGLERSKPKVPTRYRRGPDGADRCRPLPLCVTRPTQRFWPHAGRRKDAPDCHGREGVAGSSPAEGFGNRAIARFSHFRSGLRDHFRAERKGSPARVPPSGASL